MAALLALKRIREDGDILAPIVVICEGVNNLLTQKLGLIKHDLEPSRVALGIKQLISLPTDVINARFGLRSDSRGLAVSVLGDVSLGLPGMGFSVYWEKQHLCGFGRESGCTCGISFETL